MNRETDKLLPQQLGGIMVGCQTYDQEVVGLTHGQVATKWLVLWWVTACRQLKHTIRYNKCKSIVEMRSETNEIYV